MIPVQEGRQFDATLEGAPTGLAGTIGVRVVDPTTSTTIIARTTAGIIEFPAGSGVYGVTLTAPLIDSHPSPWTVSVLWDTVAGGEPLTPGGTFTEDLIIYGGPIPTVPGLEGTPYFTIDEFRSRYADIEEDLDPYDDATVERYRALAEEAFEDATGRAFVPRSTTESFGQSPSPYGGQRLHKHDLRRLLSATDGAGATLDLTGVRLRNGWVDGLPYGRDVTITYEYGLDQPPLRVKYAVMSLTREWMVSGPVTDRQTGIPTESGGTISLALPGGRFGTFGIPEVDATVAQYSSSGVFLA